MSVRRFKPEIELPPPSTVADARAARRAELASIRYDHEVGGTALADGTPILTDRETQMKVTAAYVKAQSEVTYTVPQWKIAPGVFVPLDAMAINAIADAIEEHVQRCFTNEAVLSGKLDSAKTIAAINAVDLQAGWP